MVSVHPPSKPGKPPATGIEAHFDAGSALFPDGYGRLVLAIVSEGRGHNGSQTGRGSLSFPRLLSGQFSELTSENGSRSIQAGARQNGTTPKWPDRRRR
jgi:hypothetical protein